MILAGIGCKVAGFLTVFASHLSVFTLTVITIERWYAITHAIHLNKRIKIRAAAVIMTGGWIYSITMSSLPLFGVSNYSSTRWDGPLRIRDKLFFSKTFPSFASICLPMETRDSIDIVYLICIMTANGFAFCVIAISYARIYLSLGKETRQVGNASWGEMTVAKKMALLVFTNFTCWAPIAFFGLTALAGFPLIDVAKSKILLVFFYPLNSCADPYLYAILTKQYRRDLLVLLSKWVIPVEERPWSSIDYFRYISGMACARDERSITNRITPFEPITHIRYRSCAVRIHRHRARAPDEKVRKKPAATKNLCNVLCMCGSIMCGLQSHVTLELRLNSVSKGIAFHAIAGCWCCCFWFCFIWFSELKLVLFSHAFDGQSHIEYAILWNSWTNWSMTMQIQKYWRIL